MWDSEGDRMTKQLFTTQKTKQRLADSFCELYQHKPIEKITIKEIVDKAGFNRSTFYQYFIDIYDVRDFVENDLLMEMERKMLNIEEHSMTIQELIIFFESKEERIKAVFGDYGSIRFMEMLKEKIPNDQRLTSKNVPQNEVPYCLEFHIYTFMNMFRLWIKRGRDISVNEFFALVEKLYMQGISCYEDK